MIHLIKNKNGKFDIKITGGSHLIFDTSPQGYERKSGAYKAIRSGMKNFGSEKCVFQDETEGTPLMFILLLVGKPILDVSRKRLKTYQQRNQKTKKKLK